ncbi:MAG TPA: hypothetical protein VIX41_05190 [Acidimicrobiales bacterium]
MPKYQAPAVPDWEPLRWLMQTLGMDDPLQQLLTSVAPPAIAAGRAVPGARAARQLLLPGMRKWINVPRSGTGLPRLLGEPPPVPPVWSSPPPLQRPLPWPSDAAHVFGLGD